MTVLSGGSCQKKINMQEKSCESTTDFCVALRVIRLVPLAVFHHPCFKLHFSIALEKGDGVRKKKKKTCFTLSQGSFGLTQERVNVQLRRYISICIYINIYTHICQINSQVSNTEHVTTVCQWRLFWFLNNA